MEEGGEEEDFLAHSFGVGGEGVVAVGPEPDEVEQVIHLGFERAAGDAAEPAGELEILAAAEVGIEVRLLGNIAEAALEGFEIEADVLAVHGDAAGGGLEKSGEHLDGGAFSGAVGAEIAENFTRPDGEADAIYGGGADEGLSQVVGFEHEGLDTGQPGKVPT